MQKLVFCLLTAISIAATAQKKFDEYTSDRDVYQIQISLERDSSFYLWIDTYSMDDAITKCGFMLNRERQETFTKYLEQAKQKFIEWSEVAKKNAVKDDVSKEMDIVLYSEAFFQYGSKWCFDHSVRVKFKFMVTKGLYALVVLSDELTSNTNEFMTSDGIAIFFYSPAEVDSFLKKIAIEKVNEYIRKPKKEDLFKN